MEAQSHSLTGIFSNLKDSINTNMAAAVQPLVPLIKGGMVRAIGLIGAVMPKIVAGTTKFAAAMSILITQWKAGSGVGGRLHQILAAVGGTFRISIGIIEKYWRVILPLAGSLGLIAVAMKKLRGATASSGGGLAAGSLKTPDLNPGKMLLAAVAAKLLGSSLRKAATEFADLAKSGTRLSITLPATAVGMLAVGLASKVMGSNLKTATAGMRALSASFALSPIGLIVIGLIGLGVALVVLYKKSATSETSSTAPSRPCCRSSKTSGIG